MTERLLFLVAALTAVSYFAWRVAQRLRGLAWARRDLAFDRPLERLARATGETLLQTRVLRGRPLAGFLHALVVWGFFVFAWVSVEHLALGVVGLDHAEPDQTWYGAFAAAWAIAVLLGILGLSFRRFVLRPKPLGRKISLGSAAVAALIVLLMVTYLAGWRGFAAGTAEWRAAWWLHTAAFLGMLVVIPNSKHLHLLLGPIAIFFRDGETTSATRPLDEEDDEDFGLLRFADLSRKDVLDVNACVECGRCTQVCPANVAGQSLDPKQVILQMQRGLLSAGDPAAETVAGADAEVAEGKAWVAERDLFQCLTCGACEQACPVGIEHVGKKIVDLRRGLVSEGRTHNPKLAELFTTMERAPHNAWGASQQTRRKLIEGSDFPIFDGSQQLLFWLGCGLNYDPHGNEIARAMQRLLDAAGVSWGALPQETCCGEPARRAGNEYLYLELSEKVLDALEKAAPATLVTCDPHCCRMFDVDYRQQERFRALGIEVRHHSELLAELAERLPLERREETLTFHDPCYLSRGRGVVDAPRVALETVGAELIEMRRHGKQSFCCGAGGAQLYIADDKAETAGRVNQRRFEEVVETGAATVATACPYCPIMLQDAANQAASEVRIVDIAELLAERVVQSSDGRSASGGLGPDRR